MGCWRPIEFFFFFPTIFILGGVGNGKMSEIGMSRIVHGRFGYWIVVFSLSIWWSQENYARFIGSRQTKIRLVGSLQKSRQITFVWLKRYFGTNVTKIFHWISTFPQHHDVVNFINWKHSRLRYSALISTGISWNFSSHQQLIDVPSCKIKFISNWKCRVQRLYNFTVSS